MPKYKPEQLWQLKEIKRIRNQIVKKYKPEKILLFGSFAYGKPKSSSDVDMLIIKKTNYPKVERIKKVLLKIKTNLPFEPLVYNPKEIQERLKLGDFFFQDIIKKGKVLYEKQKPYPPEIKAYSRKECKRNLEISKKLIKFILNKIKI